MKLADQELNPIKNTEGLAYKKSQLASINHEPHSYDDRFLWLQELVIFRKGFDSAAEILKFFKNYLMHTDPLPRSRK